ncbi:MAG: hypothetical protein FWF97_00905 [Alphaproteobacteria bacterium]|nr:hypothetical protein [Alphaproteobacteria bacterium]
MFNNDGDKLTNAEWAETMPAGYFDDAKRLDEAYLGQEAGGKKGSKIADTVCRAVQRISNVDIEDKIGCGSHKNCRNCDPRECDCDKYKLWLALRSAARRTIDKQLMEQYGERKK